MDFLCNHSSDKKRFIFPGRYFKADHFEKKLDMGGGPFKNAEGGGVYKTMNVKLQTFTKHYIGHGNE